MGCTTSSITEKKQIVECMSSSTLSMGLSNENLDTLAQHCKIHVYKPGEIIQSDKLIFIMVMSGEIAVSTLLPKDKAKKRSKAHRPEALVEEIICRKVKGDLFCLNAHLNYLTKPPGRRASMKIDLTSMRCMKRNTKLIELPTLELQRLELEQPGFSCLLHGIIDLDLSDYLSKIDFFNFNLQDDEKHEWHHVHKVGKFDVLKCFAEICQLKAVKEGTVLFKRGDYQRYMYSVLRGEVSLYEHGPDRAHVDDMDIIMRNEKTERDVEKRNQRRSRRVSAFADLVTYMGHGDTFGEAALMINMPSLYAARCSQDSLLCVIDREHFKYVMDALPSVKAYCYERVRINCINQLKEYNIPFFAPFLEHNMEINSNFEHYLKQFELRQYNNTKYVYRQGELANELYIVVGGLVQLQYDNKKVADIRCGMSFGDESLFVRNPQRLMSAVVLEPTCVLVGNLDDFHEVFKNDPSVIHEFAIKYLGKDVDLSHVINHPEGREAFRTFLKSEYNDENLLFWEDIRTVRHVAHFKDTPTNVWMKRSWQWRGSSHSQRSGSLSRTTNSSTASAILRRTSAEGRESYSDSDKSSSSTDNSNGTRGVKEQKDVTFAEDAVLPSGDTNGGKKDAKATTNASGSNKNDNSKPDDTLRDMHIIKNELLKNSDFRVRQAKKKNGDNGDTLEASMKRRTTDIDAIVWPAECSLLEYSIIPTNLHEALELCYQLYVNRDGERPVNISEQMVEEIEKHRLDGTWTSETFVKAQEEVYHIMARDVHARFVQSAVFKNLSKSLGGVLSVAASAEMKSQTEKLPPANDDNDNLFMGNTDKNNATLNAAIESDLISQFKRKDTLYRKFSDLNGPSANEAAKLSQVGLSPNDLKLSTRRSYRSSSVMLNVSSYGSMGSRSSRASARSSVSLARSKDGKNHTRSSKSFQSVNSLESVPSASSLVGNHEEGEEGYIVNRSTHAKSIGTQLSDIIDVVEVVETEEGVDDDEED